MVPGRRGLAAGLTSAGFGAGAAITVIPLTIMIKNSGYQQTFLVFGLIQGLIIVISRSLCSSRRRYRSVAGRLLERAQVSKRDYAPHETLRSPVFWIMYVMFVLVGSAA